MTWSIAAPAVTAAFSAAIVEVVAVHGDQRPPELLGQPEMFEIGRTPEIFLLDDEQHIPVEARSHVRHEAGRNVRVRVDPRPRGQSVSVRREFGRESTHGA